MKYGETIKTILNKYGKNGNDLAKASGIPRKTIYTILYRNPPTLKDEVLNRILWALGVSKSYFEELKHNGDKSILYNMGLEYGDIGDVGVIEKSFDTPSNVPIYELKIRSASLETLIKIASKEDVRQILLESIITKSPEVVLDYRPAPIFYEGVTYDNKEEFEEIYQTSASIDIDCLSED